MKEFTGTDILQLPMEENDSGADTIGGYFVALLSKLFEEEESFSGKRPFGNSGWTWDIYKPLAAAGAIAGAIPDEYGDLDLSKEQQKQADQLIFDAIDALNKAAE